MIKIKKAAYLAAGLFFCLGAAGVAACSDKDKTLNGTYQGEYHYTNYGTEYGVKVSVEVQENVIGKVTILASDYTEATAGWAGAETYENSKAELCKAYEGKTVSEILKIEVAKDDAGTPLASDKEGFKEYDKELIITGATQSSGRLLLAVQNALKSAK